MNKQKEAKLIRHVIYGNALYPKPKPSRFLESQLTANLTLQKLLYYNTYYSVLFMYLDLGVQVMRLWIFRIGFLEPVQLALLIIWGILEIFRIQNGYSGNIKEQFPELFSFLLITFMSLGFQVGLLILSLIGQIFYIEFGLHFFMLFLYFMECLGAIYSMCSKSQTQVALLFLRIPSTDPDFQIRKEIEHKKMQMQLMQERQEEEEELENDEQRNQ
ncbi:hypothetical protein pb186bvf_009575 [Paramecium bursaria]